MKNGVIWFNFDGEGFEFNRSIDVPRKVIAFVDAMRDLFCNEAFMFIRFSYEDMEIEIRRYYCERYTFAAFWKEFIRS